MDLNKEVIQDCIAHRAAWKDEAEVVSIISYIYLLFSAFIECLAFGIGVTSLNMMNKIHNIRELTLFRTKIRFLGYLQDHQA